MNTRKKFKFLLSLLLISNLSFAQSSSGDTNVLLYTLIAIGLILLLWAIMALSDSLLKIEAEKHGINPEDNDIGIMPKMQELFAPAVPQFVDGRYHRLRKGYDLKIAGKAESNVVPANASRFALKPKNFLGLSPIPKVEVVAGDEVLVGDVIFYDKKRPEVKHVAPVSGEVMEVKRGAKRAITEIIILADKEQKKKAFSAPNIETCNRQDLVDTLLDAGCWPLINQRPFDVIPGIGDVPANIFVSSFSTAPLAADKGILLKGKEAAFQKGLDVLSKLTVGKVYLGLDGNNKPASVFTNATGVEKNYFSGKHPAGNVGVQIHHTAPIRNEKVWTVGPQEVATIGSLFLDGKLDFTRKVAITGTEVNSNKYLSTYAGANIGDLLKGNLKDGNTRIIAGDVLSGKIAELDGFLNNNTDQLTVIPEGDNYEMLGWLLPLKPRPSASNTLPTLPGFEYEVDTNTHGEGRAFVVTGQYESVLPMDIYPQHLMKAILTNDIERMEGLGINELSEEDIALCEFVCTSKQPLQSILRQGLDAMREQL